MVRKNCGRTHIEGGVRCESENLTMTSKSIKIISLCKNISSIGSHIQTRATKKHQGRNVKG
uniref:Uncharacterized protein n=1 Tax=Arundo donax TaxID=35708 RepID=A0A0A9EI85_ARUDO